MKKQWKIQFSQRAVITFIVMGELVVIIAVAWLLRALLIRIFDVSIYVSPLLLLVVCSLVIGGALTNYMGKWVLAPVAKLGKAMKEVATGDFSVRLDTNSRFPEVRDIFTDFNKMAEELSMTETVQTDFVSNVSHEFKTPINAIEGYAMLLQDEDRTCGNAESNQYIEKILFNTRRLSELVGNILLLAKADHTTLGSRKSEYRLDEQIRHAIVLLEAKWEAKEIDMDAELEPVSYCGDETMLLHVWSNLIDNAIKFSPYGGCIWIKMGKEFGHIIFTVRDQGPGVAEMVKNHIFDKFYQADSSHEGEGNGLGLALVKRIVELSDGTVYVENNSPCGCTFTVLLAAQ